MAEGRWLVAAKVCIDCIVATATGITVLLRCAAATAFFVHGGAKCTGCSCYDDTWILSVATGVWRGSSSTASQDEDEDCPIHPDYRHSVTGMENRGTVLFSFGGESYRPGAYWNDILDLPWRLWLRLLLKRWKEWLAPSVPSVVKFPLFLCSMLGSTVVYVLTVMQRHRGSKAAGLK